MKKTIPLLIVPIVVLSVVNGLLFNQLIVVQNENSELKNELFEVRTNLEEEQNTSLNLETQITQLQNQLEQLEQNIVEVETQRNELEQQINEATNRVKIVKLSAYGFGTIAGLTMESFVDVTIQNSGINDVENLTLTITTNSIDTITLSYNVTVIQTGEKLVINGQVWYGLMDMDLIVATLELDNQIIDEYKISINDALSQ